MAMDKDQSIITQVAAKIASELTINNANIAQFSENFDAVKELIMTAIYGDKSAMPELESEIITKAFPTATEQAFTVTVKGQQHGPLPTWLLEACKRDGITEVYDNRDGLAQNPKRPWFKAVNDKEKAYWAPKGS
jgi:hypothetical protein